MPFLPDVPHARFLMVTFGGWFGGPIVRLRGKVVDGSKRLQAWGELALKGEPPELATDETREAARLVLLAGHTDRAHALLGASIGYDANTATLLRVPGETGAVLVARAKHKARPRRPAPRRRAGLVEDLRRLYLDCAEHGHELTLDDLRRVLNDWA